MGPWSKPLREISSKKCAAARGSQISSQELRAGNGIEQVGLDRDEAERLVQLLRRGHARKSIEADPCVTGVLRFAANLLGEPAPELLAASLRPHVEALHLAGHRVDRPQRHAADRLVPAPGQQEPPGRGRILAGQRSQLFVELLKVRGRRPGCRRTPEKGREPPRGLAEFQADRISIIGARAGRPATALPSAPNQQTAIRRQRYRRVRTMRRAGSASSPVRAPASRPRNRS